MMTTHLIILTHYNVVCVKHIRSVVLTHIIVTIQGFLWTKKDECSPLPEDLVSTQATLETSNIK